jgi:hypothetical protein
VKTIQNGRKNKFFFQNSQNLFLNFFPSAYGLIAVIQFFKFKMADLFKMAKILSFFSNALFFIKINDSKLNFKDFQASEVPSKANEITIHGLSEPHMVSTRCISSKIINLVLAVFIENVLYCAPVFQPRPPYKCQYYVVCIQLLSSFELTLKQVFHIYHISSGI